MPKKVKNLKEKFGSYGGMNRAGTRDMDTTVILAEHSPRTYEEALDLILTTEKEEI